MRRAPCSAENRSERPTLGWFAHPVLGVLGVLFVLVWGYLLSVRSAVNRTYFPTIELIAPAAGCS
ncbi:MAG: DUF4233 domain-containing protein [Pseudonocardiaceae bacterium]